MKVEVVSLILVRASSLRRGEFVINLSSANIV